MPPEKNVNFQNVNFQNATRQNVDFYNSPCQILHTNVPYPIQSYPNLIITNQMLSPNNCGGL
jgi:hypothetical protein